MTQVAPIESKIELPPVVEEPKPIMQAVRLKRHYRPKGIYEVVGWWKPEIKGKDPKDGPKAKEKVLVPAEFLEEVEDDDSHPNFGKVRPAPPPMPGTGTASVKLWASTVVRLPKDEAKRVVNEDIGVAEIE